MKTLIASLLYAFGIFAFAMCDAKFWNWTTGERIGCLIVALVMCVLASADEADHG